VAQNHSWSAIAEKTMSVYRRVLGRSENLGKVQHP